MNIVEKLIKIDLHIHSDKSAEKDGDLVAGGTKENIEKVLIPNLEKYHVNLAAITDHNIFSYDYYQEFKKYSNNGGHLLKVLPGIELDLDIEGTNIDTHAIAIFDDKDDKKVKLIESIVEEAKKDILKKTGVGAKNLLFKPTDAIDLFRKIGLSFVLIVHQKADPDNNGINQEHNIAESGVEKFNELISYDYFDAIEFKNYKVEGFLVAHKNKYNKEYNALCGSDCHVWDVYPKHDKDEKESFKHCYLNALPTFKGLAMALTGDNRIHFSTSEVRDPYLKRIDFSINGKPYTVNLSSGLNVLIGDNSIGKSFFLELLNNPNLDKSVVNDSNFSKKLDGYKTFKKKNNFSITSKTLENDSLNVDFHRQGHIRSLFEGENKSIEDQQFLKKYFVTVDTTLQENTINSFISSFITYSQTISDFSKSKTAIDNASISLNPELNIGTYNLSPLVDKERIEIRNYNSLISKLSLINSNIAGLLKEDFLESADKKTISEFADKIDSLIKKYKSKDELEKTRDFIYSIITRKMNEKSIEIRNKSTELEQRVNLYKKEKSEFVELLSNHFLMQTKKQNNTLVFPSEIVIEDAVQTHEKYKFISRVKKNRISRDDICSMLISPINNCTDLAKIKDAGFDEISKRINAETSRLPFNTASEKYKQACINYSKENWLQKEKGSIISIDESKISGNSAGLNAQYYLDLYTLLEKKKLFIIDQPEDDVSEARISKELKTIMRNMSSREQILFVTHNAELVVNLDVDNVIVFKNDEQGNLSIANGALEYEDEHINILNEVADLLDGGAEVIRKRWKRYEKNQDYNKD